MRFWYKGFILSVSLFFCWSAVVAGTTKFQGTQDNQWSNSANWDNGVPQAGDDVIIDADCVVDNNASIPTSINSLVLNATLDDYSAKQADFTIENDLTINNGGEFLAGGEVYVKGNYYHKPGANAIYYSLFTVDLQCEIESRVSFRDDFTVGDDVYIGNNTLSSAPFTAEFLSDVMILGSLTVSGSEDGSSRAVFEGYTEVDLAVYISDSDSLIVGSYLSTADIYVGVYDVGVVRAPGSISCQKLELSSSGVLIPQGDMSCLISSEFKMNGYIDSTAGTFELRPQSGNLAIIYPNNNTTIHNLIISGDDVVFIDQYDVNDPQDLNIQGSFQISAGATFNPDGWTVNLQGDFICEGFYDYGTKQPLFVFKGGKTQNLSGNVAFYDLKITTGTTVNTGSYAPSVEPQTLIEDGYLLGAIQCMENISDDATYAFGNLGFQVSNGADLGLSLVERHTGSTYTGASHSVKRWYNFSPGSADNFVTLRLYYRDSELNGNDENNLYIWRYDGTNWQKYVPTTRNTTDNYVEANVDIPGTESFWILSDAVDDQSLPVELISFSAIPYENNSILLQWATASEVENAGFEIWKRSSSHSQNNWEKIAYLEGAGNTNMTTEYRFIDSKVEPGIAYDYELYSVNFNGVKERVGILQGIIIGKDDQVPTRLTLYPNYPNPFNQSTVIRYYLPEAGTVELTIYDANGRNVYKYRSTNQSAGFHSFYWNGKDMSQKAVSSGVYFYQLSVPGKSPLVRKMMLTR